MESTRYRPPSSLSREQELPGTITVELLDRDADYDALARDESGNELRYSGRVVRLNQMR